MFTRPTKIGIILIAFLISGCAAVNSSPSPESAQSETNIGTAIGEFIGGALKIAVAGAVLGLAAYGEAKAQQRNQRLYYQNGFSNIDLSGCCSWHGGLSRNILGNAQCHWTGRALCNDGQPSPTCSCK